MPYFIPNEPGVFAAEDEALAAAQPKPTTRRTVKPAEKTATAPPAPKEG